MMTNAQREFGAANEGEASFLQLHAVGVKMDELSVLSLSVLLAVLIDSP